MDYELIFWLVVGMLGAIALLGMVTYGRTPEECPHVFTFEDKNFDDMEERG